MHSLSQLSTWIGGVSLAGGLIGCGDSGQASSAAELAGSQAAQYPANDCRSAYALTTQKGCTAGLPWSTAGNLGR